MAGSLLPTLFSAITVQVSVEPSLGLEPWWEVGAYFQTAVRRDGTFDYAGVKLRSKFVTPPTWHPHLRATPRAPEDGDGIKRSFLDLRNGVREFYRATRQRFQHEICAVNNKTSKIRQESRRSYAYKRQKGESYDRWFIAAP